MERYAPSKDLASRDVVSRAMTRNREQGEVWVQKRSYFAFKSFAAGSFA